MHVALRILLWVLAGITVLLAGMYAYLQRADLTVYESQIEGFLSSRLGHKVDFDGLFELQFGNITYVTAEDVRITNENWPGEPVLLNVGHMSVSIEVWTLLRGPVIIQDLEIDDVDISLAVDEQGNANWHTVTDDPAPESGGNPLNPGNFVAFHRLRVENVDFLLTSPLRQRPFVARLDALSVAPDVENVLDLELDASINELPLTARGKFGPWTNLIDGQDIRADVDVTFGDSRLDIEGHIDDLYRLEGVETKISLVGPRIDRVIETLEIPPFAEGEFRVDAVIDAEEQGTLVSLVGNLGEITILAEGEVERFIGPDRVEFDVRFAGPDAKHVAEVFGIERVTQAPFDVGGHFAKNGSRYTLTGMTAQFATGELKVDGWLDLANPVPDGDLSIESSGPDLSAIGALSGISGIPAETFDWRGRVMKSGRNWRFENFAVRVGANRFAMHGELDRDNDAVDQIDIVANGPDVSVFQELLGRENVPARPYDVSVRLRPHPDGVRVENAVGTFGENRLELDGVLGLVDGLSGTELDVRASGPELHNVAILAGTPFLPEGEFLAQTALSIDDDTLTLTGARVSVMGIEATASGTVGLGAAAGELDLTLAARGPDLAGLAEFDFIEQFSNQPFDIDGRLASDGVEYDLDDINATIGTLKLHVDGQFAGDASSFDLRLRADAPDADVLDDFDAIRELPDGPVVVAGRVERTGDDLEFSDTEFAIGEYRFSADGTLSMSPMSNDSDLKFGASGPELHYLGRVFGYYELPPKPFSMSAEAIGIPSGFAIEELVARVGDNDATASFTINLQGKPEIAGTITSDYIDLDSPMLQPDEDEQAEGTGSQFLFSDEPLDSGWLQAANVDIELSTGRAILTRADVHDIHIRLRMWDGELDIAPFTFREMDGGFNGELHLRQSGDGYELDTAVSIESIHLGFKAPDEVDRSNVPPLDGNMTLSGGGRSLHEILASADGRIDFRHGTGKVRRAALNRLFGDIVTEVIRTLNPLSRSQPYTNLECGIYRIDIDDGLANIENFAMQSDTLTVIASGKIDLKTERINVSLRSKPREGFGVSLGGVANSLLKLGGTLQNPRLQIDAASSVTTTGAAVATGGLSLLARGLWDRVSAESTICEEVGEQPNQD